MPRDRPHVILNAAMSLDGKIATRMGDSHLSSPEDLRRLHRLRASVDAVMVGMGTMMADDPRLTVRHVKGRNPLRIVVDGLAKTSPNAEILRADPRRPPLICVTSGAPKSRIERLERARARVLVCGRGARVNLRRLLKNLVKMGVKRLLVEGGGELNWSLLGQRLVDEIIVAISPVVVGGRRAVTLAEGRGASKIDRGVRLRLKKVETHGQNLVLFYSIQR